MTPTSSIQPVVRLSLVLASCLLSVTCTAPPFPKDLEPINVVTRQRSQQYPAFGGLPSDNDTARLGLDFQRMLRINHMLYIAARDHVFAVNLSASTDQIVPQQKLTWKTKDVEKCMVRGKNSDECYNYIKVLVPRNDETLFACGTNAFNPTCRNYKMSSLEQEGEEVVGQARCPFESHQSNVGLFAGGDFYSATMTDFLASDAVIYRSLGEGSPVLRTVKYDSKWLREPRFLHAIEYGNYVYFFLSEIAVEYTTLGKVVFSRVARVCKNDNGGSPRVLERYWTSFLKARLNCSVPGDSFFYFDVLQSLSNVLQVHGRPAVMGLFSTQANSITGSAVCAFYMDDIERVFNGKFKEQKSSESAWTPVPEDQVPKPRPGTCAGDGPASSFKSSTSFPDDVLVFIKSYPLMDEAVPSIGDQPCYTRTTSRYKLTQIAVDTSAGPYRNHTVLFLGSDDGKVLKVLANNHPNATFSSQLLEDMDLYNPSKCNLHGEDRRILGLELDKENHALFVAFSSCVIRVPLSRCADYSACKRSCLSSRDPYCIWLKTGSCATSAPGFKAGFEQDVESSQTEYADSCHDVLATTRRQNTAADSAYGVRRLPDGDRSSYSVHYTLLIACVLVAFVLGAFLSGFLVSCYCSRGSHRTKRLGKDSEAPLPHALSLRSLAKLNGLLDPQAKEDKMEVSPPAPPGLYNSFIPNGKEIPHGGKCLSGPGDDDRRHSNHHLYHADHHHGNHHHHHHHHGEHHLHHQHGDQYQENSEELSGLPTPDSTPELPIKNMKAFRSPWERNQNCNNGKDPGPNPHSAAGLSRSGSSLSQQLCPFPAHGLANGQLLGGGVGGAFHPEDRPYKVPSAERAPYQGYPHTVVDVSALDELLRHIQQANATAVAGGNPNANDLAVLTSSSGLPAFAARGPQIPETESAPYYSSTTLPRDSLTRRLDVPPEAPAQSTLERPSRQKHSLVNASKMSNGVPRQHSFGHPHPHHHPHPHPHHRSAGLSHPTGPLLGRVGSSGVPGGDGPHHPLIPNGYLSRQHSYSEQNPPTPRVAIVRRSASLKPDVPPKPLFLPATSPVSSQGKYNY
ncbi:semaphorin-6D-like [Conger conger]|uniref:semaphorin-6D-like n=1 Tax=Conger conger TaxID=82655 RepID=UPI002A5A2EDC|nr:semaphorin-6D-like [Conger conger]